MGGSVLATCWVNFPVHVVIGYYYFTSQSGTIVVFEMNRLLTIVFIAGAISVFFGVLGYVTSSVVKYITDHSGMLATQ